MLLGFHRSGERPGGGRGSLARRASLVIQPSLEFRAAGEVKAGHQLTAVELHRALEVPLLSRCGEIGRFAPEQSRIKADLLVTPSTDDLVPDRGAHGVNRLAQGTARPRLIELRPE